MKLPVLLIFLIGMAHSSVVTALDVPSDPDQPNNPCGNWNARQEPKFYTATPNLKILSSGVDSNIDSLMRLQSGNNKFSSHVKGCTGEKKVWLSPSNDYNYYSKSQKGHAIALRFYPTKRHVGNGTDKMMWNLRDSRTGGAIRMGQTVYTAFAFKVPETFSAPLHNQNFMIFQVWQGSPFRPPVSMHVNGTGIGDPNNQALSLELRLNTLNGDKYTQQVLLSTPLERGKWIELIVGVHFSRTDGAFSVYKRDGDHFELLDSKQGLQTAYQPLHDFTVRENVEYHPNETAQVLIGLYRMRQPFGHTVIFDEIRVGNSMDAVLLPEPAG